MRTTRVAVVALIFFEFLLPIALARGTFSNSLAKSFQSQTIICVKGSAVKREIGAKPECPTGYKKKLAQANRIALSLLPSYPIGSTLINLPKTSSASLLVGYKSNSPLICSISQNQVQLRSPGQCTITATQAGAEFIDKAVPVRASFDVIGQNVISITTPIADAKISDQPLTFLVTATSGLAVTGQALDPNVCNLVGNTIQYLHIGRCQIRWSQSGNIFYSTADPVLTAFTISQANQINFSLAPSYKISLKATDLTGTSTSALPLSYQSATPLICSISQNQVQLLSPGQCTITTTQAGAEFIDKAVPVNVSFDVIGQNVISITTPIGDAKISDQPLTYLVTASSGLAVMGEVLDPNVCNLVGNTIQYLHIGLCQIRWSQSGNIFYSTADPVLTAFTISLTNKINFSLAPSYKITLKAIDLPGTSTTSLPLSYQSATPLICSISQNQVQLLTPGQCTITATQAGAEFVDKAVPVSVSFDVIGQNAITFNLPSSLLLGLVTYSLAGNSSSGLAVSYESLTADICSISKTTLVLNKIGSCTIRASQPGTNYYEPAQTVEVSTYIAKSRVTADQPDIATGFQIKAIYVVPSDGTDHAYDTNGYIAGILDEANSYLKEQLGLQLQIDRTNLGYDIQFLKSKLTTAEMMHSGDLLKPLLDELKAMDNPGDNRKNYTFFVDVPSLEDGIACGYAREPGMVSVVAIGTTETSGSTCTGPGQSFQNYATLTLVHENFHNFGVGHFNDSCDLMKGAQTCRWDQRPTIDKERTRYVGASALGVGDTVLSQDILKLNVWQGYTSRTDLQADCILNPGTRSDGLRFAYCPTGTQTIGALTYCWKFITSDSLEELINGSWVSLGAGSSWNQPWGTRISRKCNDPSYVAPWKQLTVTTPGVHHYRWIVNGSVGEELNVIWVQ